MCAHDVRDWKVDALLSSFSMVFKDVYLFDDTIESDIEFGRPQTCARRGSTATPWACASAPSAGGSPRHSSRPAIVVALCPSAGREPGPPCPDGAHAI
ncbi:hypothetical protein HMPREF1316_0258 [Olsenella profusa F0195]|uniref:Uncharacterized protein n=1 Tax=Olsenella profusa F0195 TaxID=1125712 RepID=U2TQ53_9ACTN|nr:hypothetical protein HMPREF1316_0258 [Olsenella profusa F0195]